MDELLESYARDLNDLYPGCEFSLWSKEQLLGYLNDALCFIARQSPSMFTEKKVVEVSGCDVFLPQCGCTYIKRVLGQSTADGRLLHPLTERPFKQMSWTGKRSSPARSNDKLSTYEIDRDTFTLRVNPPIAPNKKAYVLIECSVQPEELTLDSTPPSDRCAFMAAARHYVLYSAKMVDGEFSSGMRAAASEHREMFFGMLSAYESARKAYIGDKK